MKQNTRFSYVKRNDKNSGGADSNKQCSSNVRGHLIRSEPNLIQLPKLENGMTYMWNMGLFAGWPKSECSRYIPEMQERPSHYISCFLTSVTTVYLSKCIIKKYLIFLQVIRFIQIFVNGDSMTNANAYQGFHDDKKIEEHFSRHYAAQCRDDRIVAFYYLILFLRNHIHILT